jgi:serine/threonine protein kinase
MDLKKPSGSESPNDSSSSFDSDALGEGLSEIIKEEDEKSQDNYPPQDPLLGRTLVKKYTIQKKLGEGGFGAVYEAHHQLLDCKIAIKTLHMRAEQSKTMLERFRREALATSRLTHPYAVKIYDRGETKDGLAWIAMELLQGETLSAFLRKKGCISEQKLIELMGPICEVLQDAHDKGIVHRDLKPENIMLVPMPNGSFIPKILDFGIAAILNADTLTQTGTVSGTPKYMAPEQWEGLNRADARSDIYSLGTIAYLCLTGRFPFEADSALSWMKKHYSEKPLPLEKALEGQSFSPVVSAAVMKSISKAPADRQQTAREFLDSLRVEQKEVVAAPPQEKLSPEPLVPTEPALVLEPTMSPILTETLPDAIPERLKHSRYLVWALIAAPLLLAAFYVPSLFDTPKVTAELSPVPMAPLSLPVDTFKTKEPAPKAPVSPVDPVTEPNTPPNEPNAAPVEVDKNVAECTREDKPMDSLMASCVAAENVKDLSDETKKRIAKVKAQYKQQHLLAAKQALEKQDAKGLADGKKELAKVSKYFPLPDIDCKLLSDQQKALEAKLKTSVPEPPVATQTPQEILKEADEAKSIDDMCVALKRFLKFYPTDPKTKEIKAKIDAQDAIVNHHCE